MTDQLEIDVIIDNMIAALTVRSILIKKGIITHEEYKEEYLIQKKKFKEFQKKYDFN